MIKKKYLVLLSMLLLTVFLGLSGNCYAKELTDDDIKNFIYNYCIFYGYTDEQAQSYVSSFVNLPNANDNTQLEIDRWKNIANNLYPGQYILWGNSNSIGIWRYGSSDEYMRLYGPYYYKQYDTYRIYTNTSYLNSWNTIYQLSNPNNLTTTYSQGSAIVTLGTTENQFFFYTDTNVYTNSTIANGSIKYSSGYMTPSNLFEGYYGNGYFDIDINVNFRNNIATIKGDSSGTEYYLIPYNSSKIRIGNMFDYSNLEGVIKRKFRYKQSLRDFELIQEFESDTNNLEYYSIADDTLVVYEYYQADTIEFITFIPKADTGFSEFTVPIYFVTDNTSITNGVIDNVVTFSGDYYNNYNNDTNTDKVINNTNDGSEVIGQLNEFVSGDSEDLAKKLGFQLIGGVDYYNFIQYNIQKIVDILAEDENVYFDYSMHGETPTRIYASDFTTSPSLFKTFGCLFLIACTIFVFYFQMTTFLESLATLQFTSAIDWLTIDRSIFRM